ncbi:MAG: M20/M25/M40 family metallo-hydrolase [Theionarchaea archaeon]|nr:M20/M25/M40 family metallo-hydrolase [Theionarchaea archaeon]MBU7020602.1 M20/M25/M40 family metallo-hydrolase [Theionarchaea archaeon]MBU7034251.1 M20/M25/M40 family metallo-hydrolase [Theionarchaea archaeon]MBU7039325.1 M20/M25/M40 family metallo-hydrolase [Theionarchaea archaeon]
MTNVEALKELLKIPSVSAHHQAIQDCAEKVTEFLQEAGFHVQIIPTEGHPVVFGEKKGISDKTLIFYDHYDVQPPDPLDQWVTPPFEPDVRDNRLYARGVADNKGNIMARLAAVESFDRLPITIKFIIEGEEEIGSPSLQKFVETHKSLLKADACIWEAGYKDEAGRPTMCLGAKGLCYVQLRAHGSKRDLHSAFAVIVENPAWRLIRALTTLKDSRDHILIEGFYQDVEPPTAEERAIVDSIPYDGDKARAMLGVDHFLNDMSDEEAVYHLLYGPSCNICGILSGYTGQGSKTVLPADAMAKIDFRLVPRQDPQKIFQLLTLHLEKHGFSDIDTELMGPLWPAKTPVTAEIVSVTEQSMRAVYENPPVIYPTMSGSGPMWLFTDVLGIPTVSIGVGDAESRTHSPNESISLSDYEEGINVITEIIKRM